MDMGYFNENKSIRKGHTNPELSNMDMNIEYSVSTADDEIGISTVIQEMQKQIDAVNINDESPEFDNSANCLHQYRHKGVPLAVNNARLHMFLCAMKSEGKEYQVVDTAWGPPSLPLYQRKTWIYSKIKIKGLCICLWSEAIGCLT